MGVLLFKTCVSVVLLIFFWLIGSSLGEQIRLDISSNISQVMEIDFNNSQSVTLKIFSTLSLYNPVIKATDNSITITAPDNSRVLGFVKMSHLRASVVWTNRSSADQEENGEDEILDYLPQCLDFISVEESNGPEKICHDVHPEDQRLHPPSLIGPRILRGVNGQIKLHIHTEKFEVGTNPIVSKTIRGTQKKVRKLAEIVFTLFSECPAEEKIAPYSQESEYGTYRCSNEEVFACIPSSLVCDQEIHCLFPDSFGEDERGCEFSEEMNMATNNVSQTSYESNSSADSSETKRTKIRNNVLRRPHNKDTVLVKEREGKYQEQIRQFFVPTAAFLFLIWGLVTLLRKCYKCYRTEYGKDDFYY